MERMARYRPIDFLGKKDDEPSNDRKLAQKNRENASTNALHTKGKFRVCDLTTLG